MTLFQAGHLITCINKTNEGKTFTKLSVEYNLQGIERQWGLVSRKKLQHIPAAVRVHQLSSALLLALQCRLSWDGHFAKQRKQWSSLGCVGGWPRLVQLSSLTVAPVKRQRTTMCQETSANSLHWKHKEGMSPKLRWPHWGIKHNWTYRLRPSDSADGTVTCTYEQAFAYLLCKLTYAV